MLTIQDALKLDALKNCRVVGGVSGLGRSITSVNQMDAPDFINWTKENQFIVTTGYYIRDDVNEQRQLLLDMAEKNCAGLGMKIKRFFRAIPQNMIDIADELGLPLIEIPFEYNISEIMNELMKEILTRQTRELERSHLIHDKFTEIALLGGGLNTIAELLGEFVNTSVCILDSGWKCMGAYEHDSFAIPVADLLAADKVDVLAYQRLIDGHKQYTEDWLLVNGQEVPRILYPIAAGKKLYGFVCVWNAKLDTDFDTVAVEHAATVAGFELLQHRALAEMTKRFSNDFFSDYLSGQIKSRDILIRRGSTYGINAKANYICIVIDIDQFTNYYLKELGGSDANAQLLMTRLLTLAETAMGKQNLRGVTFTQSDQVVILLQVDVMGELMRDLSHELILTIKELIYKNTSGFTVTAGVGIERSALTLHESYAAAVEAVHLGRVRNQRDGIAFFDDLFVEHLLVSSDHIRTENLYRETVLKLETHDQESGTELVKTLETFFRNKYNISEAAKEIFVHRNTLTYRLDKIQEILGISLEDHNNLLKLQLALKAREILRLE